MLKMYSTSFLVYSLNLFLNSAQLCSEENFPVFSPARLLIQKLCLASDEAFKKASYIATQT